jgi:hypothetical protein
MALRLEVQDRAESMQRRLDGSLAIEQALMKHGLLRIQTGEWR